MAYYNDTRGSSVYYNTVGVGVNSGEGEYEEIPPTRGQAIELQNISPAIVQIGPKPLPKKPDAVRQPVAKSNKCCPTTFIIILGIFSVASAVVLVLVILGGKSLQMAFT